MRHFLETLVRQRVFQIACGYEDQDDADTLRTDPLLKLVCGRLPDEANLADSRGAVAVLKRVVRLLRARWPQVTSGTSWRRDPPARE